MSAVVDWRRCEDLAVRGANGDAAARRLFVEAMWPVWKSQVRASRAMAGLARSEDHVRDVLVRVVEKIERDSGHTLKLYSSWRERQPEKTFKDWMAIVVANTVRDYLRERLGPTRAAAMPGEAGEPSVKRLFNEFTCSRALAKLGHRPPVTTAQTARQLIEFARDRLPGAQGDALIRWIDGATFTEIEEELGLEESDEGRKLVRAAIAALRRHFAGREGSQD